MQLSELKNLNVSGVLTDEEYASEKESINYGKSEISQTLKSSGFMIYGI